MGADCRPAKVMILGDRFDREGSFINYGDAAMVHGLHHVLADEGQWKILGRSWILVNTSARSVDRGT